VHPNHPDNPASLLLLEFHFQSASFTQSLMIDQTTLGKAVLSDLND
jgi:hypothetical protein